ncbi:putative disease resistance RPP13-like protein 1 [Pistacia vera]|uniref:putative disease resistance RPP13-like protein 1 n=1 Tax=Pistacia vera TaxID=55513 RepID=UPI001263B6C1|nr:putative disease resistance RPP13-like protein 1 [Pistacia vera]
MPVGELFLSAFVSVLFERLTSPELLQFASEEGIRSKLKKWEKNFRWIEAVLSGLEDKQLDPKDSVSEMWLEDLRDLVYDVEDILDEFATDTLGRKLTAERHPSISRVQNCIPDCFTGLTPHAIKFNASLRSKIEEIDLGLEDLDARIRFLALTRANFGCPSAAAYPKPTSGWLPIEPAICGRDDDKAKILEIVFQDEPGDDKFRIIPIIGMGGIGKTTLAWEVYNDKAVNNFHPRAWVCIASDFDALGISKAIIESITSKSCDEETSGRVYGKLKDELDRKKFLLILDDVWNKNYCDWEYLKSAFKVGAPGSRIIVTTLDFEVVSAMTGSNEGHSLKPLSDDDCWSVFAKHAFQTRGIGAVSNLDWKREKVIAMCGGLPLAATILGGLLYTKQRRDEWEDILSKNWNSFDEGDKILSFVEKQLVFLWMSEGLIQPSNNKPPEEEGGKYFRELVSRSIFQQLSRDNTKFVMHDLGNDLAQQVSGKTCFMLKDELVTRKILGIRHSSYILLLADCCYLLKLPSKMKNLINLRHLDISGANSISEMPLGMKDLTCLQTLSNFIVGKNTGSDLEDLMCLKDLREKLCISKLENSQEPTTFVLRDMRHLKFLVLEWSPELDHPRINAEEETVLEWLQPHENLEELTIKCYAGTKFPPWVGNPSLHSKPMVLRILRLENCKNCTSLPSLGLFTSLEELIIKNMSGIRRIGFEIYGQSLVNLSFEGMKEWEHWDPIGENEHVERFPCLRKLSIKNGPKLCGAPFNHLQSLEKLVVYKCGQLVVSFSSFPRLCKLQIRYRWLQKDGVQQSN